MKLFRAFSAYTLLGFLNAGLGFLLLPVLTRYLSPEDYGIISLVNVYVSVLMPVLGLSTAGLATVEYYNTSVSKPEFQKLFSSIRIIPLLILVPLSIIFISGQSFLPGLMEIPELAYWLILPLTLFSLYASNFSTFLITTKKVRLYGITTIARVIFELAITLFFVVYIGRNWDGRIFSAIIITGGLSCISIYYYRKWNLLSSDIRIKYVRQAILFGSPLIIHQIGKFVINQSDRLFLAKMVSMEEMGIYSVGYQVGTVILILVTAFSNFFSPFLYERLNKNSPEAKREIIRVSYIFLLVISIAVIALTIATPIIFRYFIDVNFSDGTKYVFWVGLGYFFWGFYAILSGYIFFLKRTKILGYIALLNVVLNILFNYLFIKSFGAIGAAYATCLSYFIIAGIMVVVVNRLYPMPWFSGSKSSD